MRYRNYQELSAIATYTHYDYFFSIAAYQYFDGDNDWAIRLKAQGIAESGLTMTTNSVSGAVGVMQVMPATFSWLTLDRMDINDPYANIIVGAGLMAWLMGNRIIIKNRDGKVVGAQMDGFDPLQLVHGSERWKFALAGYNCGIGHITGVPNGNSCWKILQQQDKDIDIWDNCAAVLSKITGDRNAKETIAYVQRVVHYATLMQQAGEKIVK